MEIREKIIEATREIFSSMLMMEVTVDDGFRYAGAAAKNGISGIIGLAGTHKGVLAIHIPKQEALSITGNFLGMEVEEIDEDVEDAVGELANMLGGNVKTILSERGRDIELSLPTTISGENYEFQPRKNSETTIIPFSTDSGGFVVEVQLEK